MTDIREICIECKAEFAPLSSARGKEADTCSKCLLKESKENDET